MMHKIKCTYLQMNIHLYTQWLWAALLNRDCAFLVTCEHPYSIQHSPYPLQTKKRDAWLCTALQFYESQEAVGPSVLSQTQAKLLHGSICIQWLVLSALIVIQITGHNSAPKKGFEFHWTDTGKKTSFADLLFEVLNSLGLSFCPLSQKGLVWKLHAFLRK